MLVFSRFGVIADVKEGVDLFDVLESDAVEKSDVIVVDSASALMPTGLESNEQLAALQKLRKYAVNQDHYYSLSTLLKWIINSFTNYVHLARYFLI